jgi:hypothetical protein
MMLLIGEIPKGLVNGINRSFNLSRQPVWGSLAVYQEGSRLMFNVDYTLSINTVTFLAAPKPGDEIQADYYSS